MSGTLYVIATPIGNLEDLSPRATRLLKEVDLIACEDTRHTGKLNRHFQIETRLVSYHEHNEERRTDELIAELQRGKDIALVSDAGTPLVSDPGYRLVRACHEAGLKVTPVPGPSAAIAALSVSGLPTDRFLFAGFLSRKKSSREKELQWLATLPVTLILFLSPHRLAQALSHIVACLGSERRAFLVREMTKVYETAVWGKLGEVAQKAVGNEQRGEFTLVIEGAPTQREQPPIEIDAAAYVQGLQERGLSRSEALKQASRELGIGKRNLYRLLYGPHSPETDED